MPDIGALAVRCTYVAGMGDLGSMLGGQPIDVKGTVRVWGTNKGMGHLWVE